MGGRSPCCDKSKVKRGPWSPAEDVRLVSFIQKHGHPNWRSLPRQAGLQRCGKSCRLRWINYLRPDVKRGNFTPEEEHSIIQLQATFGNKWSKIASHLPGRTDNEIKNVWNTHLKKRLLPMNIYNKDPTPSSSFVSNISNEFTNQEKTLTGPMKEAAAGTVMVENADQPSTPSSTTSCNISAQDKARSCDSTPVSNDEEIKNNLQVSTLEYEVEFWNMIEPQVITGHEMMEVEKWVRSLEEELGLVGPTAAGGQQNDQTMSTIGQLEQQPVSDIRCKISEQISPFWPTSPMNFGYSG